MPDNRMKIIRKQLGITQKEMAKDLGIMAPALSRYENGSLKPSYEIMQKLQGKYNINVNWLLTGKGEMFLDGCKDCRESKGKDLDRARERIRELEAECEQIRADIASLREGHAGLKDKNEELSVKNQELNREIAERLRQIIDLQGKLIKI